MGGFNEVEHDLEREVVRVGSGVKWGDVYRVLTPKNLTTVGGRLLDVGVAGLTLGGGLSYLSDREGLACDNVLNYEVLLADGRIVNANTSSNVELFRALKGGGNNFGIVTHFTLRTFPQDFVWGGIRAYSYDQLPAILSAVAEYQSTPNKDLNANLMIQVPVTNASIGIILNMVYLNPTANPPAFRAFENLSSFADTVSIRSFEDFMADSLLLSTVDYPRWDFRTTTFLLNASLYTEVFELLANAHELTTLSNISSGTLVVGIQPIAETAVLQGDVRGGNSLGLSSRPQIWLSLNTGWRKSEDDVAVYGVSRDLAKKVEQLTRPSGHYHRYIFMNDASWDQEVIQHYGDHNVARMRAVQAKYDPDRVFQDLVRGGWKLAL
ncbi:FAD-binding domain-containing protein [Patellaria atrata CBS 101060]|uniref:FAD-binding domain-containing protein n=1 Tax=Patellaria atrata CBS 101060 TaxID=1346257 RepID=A0A9P4S264_9PEZI|nr:FAD-binding domain-containing protein [Patellaria atrata CBS 101060]